MKSVLESNQQSHFWVNLEGTEKVKEALFKGCLYVPSLSSGFKKLRFVLTAESIYLVDSNNKPKKRSDLKWKLVEPFVETQNAQKRFGFRMLSEPVFQDFYAKSQNALDHWISKLFQVCIFLDLELNLRIIRLIGSGGFGQVRLALDHETQNLRAVKSIKKQKLLESSKHIANLIEEVETMRILDHPNIVKLYKVYEDEESFHLVEDYVEGIDLCEAILENGIMTESTAARIFEQVLNALSYMHSLDICHRDIKLENVMLDSDYQVKIVDLGLSCTNISKGRTLKCGSFEYVAPEIISGCVYTSKVDMYSAGVLLYLMLIGKMPEMNSARKLKFKKSVSKEAKDLIKKMMEPNPTLRLDAQTSVKHPWITQFKYK